MRIVIDFDPFNCFMNDVQVRLQLRTGTDYWGLMRSCVPWALAQRRHTKSFARNLSTTGV